jgi:biopolymer transport protein ExbD
MVQVAAHSRAWLDTVIQVMDGVKKTGSEKLGMVSIP